MKDNWMSFWSGTLRPALKKTGIQKPYHRLKKALEAARLHGRNHENIFGSIYQNNNWNGEESVSGQGSDLKETKALLQKLPAFLGKYDIKTMIDLPCGDYNWMQHLDYQFSRYTGIDIVQAIIDQNNKRYESDTVSFEKNDCLKADLGGADILFCRDLLIHFSNKDCQLFFENIRKSKIKYLLTTHFVGEENVDIATGQWRPVNLCVAPFQLPEPIDFIIEETQMFNGRYAQTKTMALWKVSDL